MVLQISCYPCGTILLRTKAICSRRMRRLVSVKVDYMLGERYISYGKTHERVINSVLEFRCTLSFIFCNE